MLSFIASKALDAIMASHYGTAENPMFISRIDAVEYLDMMLRHKFFHRARKVPVSEQELKARGKKDKKASKDEPEENKKEDKVTDAESSHVEGKQETAVILISKFKIYIQTKENIKNAVIVTGRKGETQKKSTIRNAR